MAKETYLYGKRDLAPKSTRDLSIRQKRPIYMAKETYLYDKRDLSIRQKRPIYTAKETYHTCRSSPRRYCRARRYHAPHVSSYAHMCPNMSQMCPNMPRCVLICPTCRSNPRQYCHARRYHAQKKPKKQKTKTKTKTRKNPRMQVKS